MFAYIKGKVTENRDGYIVVESGEIGYKINTSEETKRMTGEEIREESLFYTHLHVREDIMEIYGFATEFELLVFRKLIGMSGVGPRSALAILNVAGVEQLVTAINAGKSELLTKVAGVGKKTAERVVLELKGKIEGKKTGEEAVEKMEQDLEIEQALISLGYNKAQAKKAIEKTGEGAGGFEERLRRALKEAGRGS